MKITIVGMIYKSVAFLDFMMRGINEFCLTEPNVDYVIVANDAKPHVLNALKEKRINHVVHTDPMPNDYYINRVYRGFNCGGEAATGDVIVWMNSDDMPSPGWLRNLIKHLNKDTIPSSVLCESHKMSSGPNALKCEFGRHPNEFDMNGWLKFAEAHNRDAIADNGLYMPSAMFKEDFMRAGKFPEGNIYVDGIGKHGSQLIRAGDDDLFHYNPVMRNKRHISVLNSLIYHIIEGEKDE